MSRTFDQGRERKREAREYAEKRLRSGEVDVPEDYRDIDWPNILIPTPEELVPDVIERRDERREEMAQQIELDIDRGMFDNIGVDLSDIENSLEAAFEIDLSDADQLELLQVIAETNRISAALNNLIMEQSISQLVMLNDIATAVEPPAGVTVSGFNDIDDVNEPQPVIPNSLETTVPVKTLWLRALPENNENIYLGDDVHDPANGYMIRPGESISIELDFRDDNLWMSSPEEGAGVMLLGWF